MLQLKLLENYNTEKEYEMRYNQRMGVFATAYFIKRI